MKQFDPFVLPFIVGLYFIFGVLIIKFSLWIIRLSEVDKSKIKKGFFTKKTLASIKEIFMESLLHRKVLKVNPVLGYMHMSLAFGWFLLIVFGKLGTLSFSHDFFNPLYFAIFFKYFEPFHPPFFYSKTYTFLMDFLLLFILSGLFLAIFKRFKSKFFGLKKTTKLKIGDKFALASLWCIFPLRLLAESITSGVFDSGHFLTGSLGELLATFLPVQQLMYPAWWAYSLSLGIFFIALPFSRYMHIPTEMLLIFLKNYGIKTDKEFNSFSEIEVSSCPRCGICIDQCQLNVAGEGGSSAVYFLQSLRNKEVSPELAMNCLQCGKCEEVCPVDINLKNLRLTQRNKLSLDHSDFEFLPKHIPVNAEVLYFAGCMTHLTPGIKNSMVEIFETAHVDYLFMDKDGGVCCGRPLMLAGECASAKKLMDYNREIIQNSGAKYLVTSCPICYKVFKEDYDLEIEVLHHTTYLWHLIDQNRIKLIVKPDRVAYHDPCELGRGSGIYEAPRQIIEKAATLVSSADEGKNAPCCGNSLANFKLGTKQVDLIREDALSSLLIYNPDVLATSCPLCKKTFAKSAGIPVKDIAEIVAESMIAKTPKRKCVKQLEEVMSY
ncbi:MAG: (Fe-S)-binding protein [Bacteroidetes bacterium]|nr:(Fe-S)-binding protein [Bacteroidota bacterium]